MILIGFGHKARQGKNTAAYAMQMVAPMGDVFMCAYADALRKEVRKACAQYGGADKLIAAWKESGVMPEWVHHEDGKERTLYQWWGTDFRRAHDQDYWIKRLFNDRLDKKDANVVLITDVRFPNECSAIKQRGGYLVKVTRTSKPDFTVPEHPSEQALDGYTGWDYHLQAATVPELQEKAKALYFEIARKHEQVPSDHKRG